MTVEGPLDKAKAVVRAVVEGTPKIDDSGELHTKTQFPLGFLLEHGVECLDRALAMEAALKMSGVTKEAQMLVGVDYRNDRHLSNHADVEFSLGDDKYVAVTMGERAGEVMTEEEYRGPYLQERETKGLGERRIRKSWGRPYFEAV